MLIVSATINMPQPPMCKGLEECYVNRLIVFAKNKKSDLHYGKPDSVLVLRCVLFYSVFI